ncbi:MAG TPA: protein kinase, partial [Gemmatimonadales bacterium]|nr:protein kinase [Gemmatimonadales bacterium]
MADLLQSLREALGPVYRIDRLVGEGGMATVWLAQDLRHNRPVALKLLRPEVAQAVGTERFGREIEVVARLNHPHILPLLDSGTVSLGPGWPATPYFVMPYVEGETLRARLKREKRLPESDALRIAREVAEGLDHAHRHGVLHRDVKPENILLSDGHAVIADFGIARAADEVGGVPLTRTGQTVGTPAYMSPEQITGDSKVDGRSDLYALGCMLFEMLTGTAPGIGSLGGSISGMLARRLAEDAPSVRSLNPTVSGPVDEVVQRTLARDPGDRFATPGEFAQVLSALTTGERFTLSMPRQRGRRVGLTWAIALVLVAGALGSVRLLRSDPPEVITRLAVAPLTISVSDSAAGYLGEGVQEAVVDLLRRLPRLTVTAPTLVRQVLRKEPTLTVEELGERLSVGAVLDWSLRHVGDSLHLRAELVKVPGGTLLWTGRYDRSVDDVLSLQGEIARAIGDSLRLTLGGAEVATLARKPTADRVAYDYFMRGYFLSNRATPTGAPNARLLNDSARWYASRALARDSNFAQGWTLLAQHFALASFRGWGGEYQAVLDSATLFARRALAIDSTQGLAWTALGTTAIAKDDWETAGRALRNAARLTPDFHEAQRFYAIYLAEIERQFDSAIVHARRATLIEPDRSYGFNTLGDILMRARRYDSAVPALREAATLAPNTPGPSQRLITSYERLGRWAEAVQARREAPDTTGAGAFAEALRTDGAAGYRRVLAAEWRRRIDSLEAALRANEPGGDVPPIREERIAQLHAQLGEWP